MNGATETGDLITGDVDVRLTFGTFVEGPANRLACAAARRAAHSPGTSYNPLFIYAASGLGKTHILQAIAQQALSRQPDLRVAYQGVERYLEELAEIIETGDRDRLRERYHTVELLLLDDIQFLAGRREAQEMLLRTLDELSTGGGQVVLASDRPPSEIDDIDERLLSRFSGGLIVDIGAPEFETRVAIVRRKAAEREVDLESGVAEAVARISYSNVRELQGALNRVLAVQELEERRVPASEVPAILGLESVDTGDGAGPSEFDSFLDEVSDTVERVVEDASWRRVVRDAVERWQERGYSVSRLQEALDAGEPPRDPEGLVRAFTADVERLRELAAEIGAVEGQLREEVREVLRDPDRVEEARRLVAAARERKRPFPALPARPTFEDLGVSDDALAVRSARNLVMATRPPFTPLYVVAGGGAEPRDLLTAAGRALLAARPEARIALVSMAELSRDFIGALESGLAEPWRERWRELDALFLHGVEALEETERVQDELFHIFERLARKGARIGLGASKPPGELEGVDERLRSRFEGGLVVEYTGGADAGSGGPRTDRWFRSREKLVWEWPTLDGRLSEELD